MRSSHRRHSDIPRADIPRADIPRAGMTLVEIIAALTILCGAMLGLGAFGMRFAHNMTEVRQRSTALDLATDRLEDVKVAPNYLAVDGYAGTEAAPNGQKGFSRRTIVTRVGGGSKDVVDYKIVTVEITAPAITVPVRKTTVIANY